jgi:DNA-binding HxlR family transcriptional regulator
VVSGSTHLSVPIDPEPPVFQCPVDAPVEVLGGKWKLALLFYLLQAPRRNGELRRLVPRITQKMLTQQLRELERDGIVVRTVFDVVPPKVVYAIHDDERERLTVVLDALCSWGLYWCDKTGARVLALDAISAPASGVAP